MGALKVKDPADPSGSTWINIAGNGPEGPSGPTGPAGPTGAAGPTGPTGGGAGALDDLTDVDVSTAPPAAGQALAFGAGGQWVPTNMPSGFLPLAGGTMTGPLTINVAGGSNSVVFAAPGFPNIYLLRSGDELHISQDNRGSGLKVHPYYSEFNMALTVGTDLTVGGTITDSSGPVLGQTDKAALLAEIAELRAEISALKGT